MFFATVLQFACMTAGKAKVADFCFSPFCALNFRAKSNRQGNKNHLFCINVHNDPFKWQQWLLSCKKSRQHLISQRENEKKGEKSLICGNELSKKYSIISFSLWCWSQVGFFLYLRWRRRRRKRKKITLPDFPKKVDSCAKSEGFFFRQGRRWFSRKGKKKRRNRPFKKNFLQLEVSSSSA